MPIDPSIALQGRPVQLQSPVDAYGNALALKNQIQQAQLIPLQIQQHQLQLQQAQRDMREQEQLREVFRKQPDVEKALPDVYAINPQTGMAMSKSLLEQQKARLDFDIKKREKATKDAERLGSIAGSITDEASFHRGIGAALSEGLLDRDSAAQLLSMPWSPETQAQLKQFQSQAMSAKEQHAAAVADAKAQREKLEFDTKMPGWKADAQLKQDEAAGKKPIQPYEQKQLNQAAANAAETKRYHNAKIQQGAEAAAAVVDTTPPDPNSQSILAQTGLSYPAFLTLTGQLTKLPRDKASRARAMFEAQKWANQKGVDISTMGSQYQTYNQVLSNNISRMNNTKIMESELEGTIDNLQDVVKAGDFGKLRFANVAKIWAGQEVNDDLAQQYAMHLYQLRNELAAYGAATQGRTGNNITIQDMHEAEQTIRNGIASGSLQGLSKAVQNSTGKMGTVMQKSVDAARKSVWDLFGVGGNYRGSAGSADQGAPGPSGQVSVTAPDGSVHTFANQAAADQFKRMAGIR